MSNDFQLKANEEVIEEVRQYILPYMPNMFLGFFLIFLSFFLLFPLFYKGWVGVMIFIIVIISGLYIVLRSVYMWYFSCFIITNRRIIYLKQKSLFEKLIYEALIENIQDVSHTFKGIMQTMLRYGEMQIQTMGTTGVFELKNIRNPGKIQDVLIELIRTTLSKPDNEEKTSGDKEEFNLKLLSKLSEEDLYEVLIYIKGRLGDQKTKKFLLKKSAEDQDETIRSFWQKKDM